MAQLTLATMARKGTHRQIRPLASGVTGHTTDPQHTALHIAATIGRIERGGKSGQVPVKTLTALARKGFLRLVAHPGPRRTNWAYGEITPAGRRELDRLAA